MISKLKNIFSKITEKKYAIYILLFLLFVCCYFVTKGTIDPDFGWHLKTGQLILERGVPKVDWYTFTASNFPWIDHEWLTDIGIYKIYSILGYNFLLAFFLIIFTLAFIVSFNKNISFKYFFWPVLLGYLASFSFLGIRPQIITVFFVAVLWIILNKFLSNQKQWLIYFLPVLFSLWANLHAGFFVGILIMFFILILEILKKTKLFKKIFSLRFFSGQNYRELPFKGIFILLFVFFVSIIFTFINAYGIRIYNEVFATIGDSFLRSHIVEWKPLLSTNTSDYYIPVIVYLSMFIPLLVFFRKKVDLNHFLVSIVCLFFSFTSQRNLLIFIIITFPIFAELIFYFKNVPQFSENKLFSKKLKKQLAILLALCLVIIITLNFTVNLKSDNSYALSDKAISFLKTLPLQDNMLNEYFWGGYLIWKLPERKVFIDGRMPSWRQNGQFVFGDYVKIMNVDYDTDKLLSKYNVKIVLLDKNKKDKSLRPLNFLAKQKWAFGLFGVTDLSKNIYTYLTNSGWRIIYEDNESIILRKQ